MSGRPSRSAKTSPSASAARFRPEDQIDGELGAVAVAERADEIIALADGREDVLAFGHLGLIAGDEANAVAARDLVACSG